MKSLILNYKMICYRIEEIKVVDQKNQNSNITQNNFFCKTIW